MVAVSVLQTPSDPGAVPRMISNDITRAMRAGIHAGARAAVEFPRENILLERSIKGFRYAKLTRRSIQERTTYPHTGSREAREEYFIRHKPLIDTGGLLKSFAVTRNFATADTIGAEVSALGEYRMIGSNQEWGIGSTSYGAPIWYRTHMYIDETQRDRVDGEFDRGADAV